MTEVICDLERGQGSPSKNVAMPAMHEDADLQSFLRQLGNSNPDTAPTLKANATPLASTVNPADEVTGVMGLAAVETGTQAQVTLQSSSPQKPTKRKKAGESSAERLWYRDPRILMAGGIAGCVLMIAVLFLLRGPDAAPDTVNPARDVKIGSQPNNENVTASSGDQVPEAVMDPSRQGAESVTEQMPVIASRATLEDSPVTTPVIGKHGLRFRPDQTIEMRLRSPPETVECTLEMWVTPDISIDTMGGAILLSP